MLFCTSEASGAVQVFVLRPLKQQKISWVGPDVTEKQKNFDEALVSFVAESGVSFNSLGTDSFKKVINVADRKLIVKHPATVSKHTGKLANNVLQRVCDIMAAVVPDLSSIGFTSDLWTSQHKVDSYCSLTASFIDRNFVMHRYVPFVKYFPVRHTGVNIALGLDMMIRRIGLANKPNLKLYSVNDNASNYHVAIRESEYLEEFNCCIHTVQLAVKDTFAEIEGMRRVLEKSKKIAKYAKKSTVGRSELKNAVTRRNLPWIVPKNPCSTIVRKL